MKLEKFLIQEQNSIWTQPKKKCKLHNSKCEVCDLLSRQNNKKESKIIQQTWDAVTAQEVSPDKFVIVHNYQYRHDPAITYEPSKSNLAEAMGHSKKVVRKAHKQNSLHLLNQQVQ